ncbi:hypothetical protein, partial [Salmonella sp. s51228]|uniref:hypothetical protein n=1 Tax=Salmonella sp. s51228 TaxID=3159652 RepID=UPI00398004ED
PPSSNAAPPPLPARKNNTPVHNPFSINNNIINTGNSNFPGRWKPLSSDVHPVSTAYPPPIISSADTTHIIKSGSNDSFEVYDTPDYDGHTVNNSKNITSTNSVISYVEMRGGNGDADNNSYPTESMLEESQDIYDVPEENVHL